MSTRVGKRRRPSSYLRTPLSTACVSKKAPSLNFSPCPAQSLLELHKRRKALTEPEARYYLRQIILGCQYLHRNRVIHRDLKLGNLFLNEDLEVKIGEVLALQCRVLDSVRRSRKEEGQKKWEENPGNSKGVSGVGSSGS